jgi:hypothetical protein
MSADPLTEVIWTSGELRSLGDVEAIAAVIRKRFRVILTDLVTQETRTRSHLGGCEHRFVVHHNPTDPCP